MALTDPVPSNSLVVLQRNAEDLDKALNSSSNFQNRVGDTLVPVPSALSQIASAVSGALSDIASDLAIVESERTSSIVAIDGYVNEVQEKSVDTISEMDSFLGSAQAARDNAFIDIQSDVDDVEQAKNIALQDSIPAKINELGLKYPPLAYTSGLTLNDYTQTYSYNDAIYIWGGELGTVTSGAFDEVNWSIVQKDLSGYVDSYSNTVEMESLSPTQTGQRAENRERDNSQYELAAPGYIATVRDITAANGRVWKQINRGAVKPFSDKLELRDSPKSYGYNNALISNDDISGDFRWDENSTIPDNNETVLFSSSDNSVGRWLSDEFKVNYRQPQANVIPNLKSDILDGQFSNSINVLGDSITHGANVADIHNDSYAGVLRKLTNIEFSGSSVGFVTINDTITNSEGTYQEIHTVTRSGTWVDKTLGDASDSLSGYKLTSNVAGSTLTISVPTLNKSFRVGYIRNSTAGSFTVSADGGSTVLATVNTQGAQGNLFTSSFSLEDLGSGLSEITIEVISGTVDITGIKYFDEANSPTFNVFAQSGRKIQFMSDEVIELASKTNRMLFFSLGFNDAGATGSDQDAVIERLEYLAARCKANFTKLVVSDFLWGISYDHWLRVKLRELAIAVNGATYIPFPDLFKREGYRIASGTLRDTYGFLSDGAHPTKLGHRIIAETLAKCVGYSSSSKLSAIMFNPVWTPLNLVNGWSNTFNSSRYITAWRRNGNSLQLRVALNQSSITDSLFAEMPDGFINVPLAENRPCSDASGNIFTLQAGLGLSSDLKILNAGSTGNNLVAQIEIPINNDFDYLLI